MDDAMLRVEARLTAVEYVLVGAQAAVYRLGGQCPDAIADRHARLLDELRARPFERLDESRSERAVDEIENGVRRLLAEIESLAVGPVPRRRTWA